MSLCTSLAEYGGKVILLIKLMQPVGEGQLMTSFIDNISIIRLLHVLQEDAKVHFPTRTLPTPLQHQNNDPQISQLISFIGQCVVWESPLLQKCTPALNLQISNGGDQNTSISTQPLVQPHSNTNEVLESSDIHQQQHNPQPQSQFKRKRLRNQVVKTVDADVDNSTVLSFNIDVERVKAKTRRQNKF